MYHTVPVAVTQVTRGVKSVICGLGGDALVRFYEDNIPVLKCGKGSEHLSYVERRHCAAL